MRSPLSSYRAVFTSAFLLRFAFLAYGFLQDTYSPFKFTDIDYFVFTDAARFVSLKQSPYVRDTYRYTPLLAWLLYPTTWSHWCFAFGKVLFAAGDIVTGWLIVLILREHFHMSAERALKYASLWLLNPMVAQISTRGSSEGLLGVIVVATLWAAVEQNIPVAGFLLGLAVHFKIYPFIYASSILWWLDELRTCPTKVDATKKARTLVQKLLAFPNAARIKIALISLLTFTLLNLTMYSIYLHHFTRLDHRHNFSVYNILLHLSSSPAGQRRWRFESMAFIPQLGLAAAAIPIALAKKDLPSSLFAQTFAFVTLNKVCTSQYFLWYMVFLPFYLPSSSFLRKPALGVAALLLWLLGQLIWLYEGYRLEFLGISTFVPNLWLATVFFFAVNIWILGIIMGDVSHQSSPRIMAKAEKLI